MSPDRRTWRVASRISALMALGLLLMVAAPAAAADRPGPPSEAPPRPRPRPEAAAITLESLAGQRVSLSDLRGRPVFLYFWATW